MKYKINFINASYQRYFKAHGKELMKVIEKCYRLGEFVLRDEVEKFEATLAKFLKVKFAIGVNSGTDALKVAYKALGLKPGDEVITVSHVFIAPIEEIVHLGGKPILCDVGEDGLMDVSKLEDLITERTVGIVPVHLSGKVCDMAKIMAIAKVYNLWVVEDACQALGATYRGRKAGTIGDVGCFSFIAPKTLGIGGDGGAVVTNNEALAQKMYLLHNHWNITQGALHGLGIKQPEVMGWGYNTRLDNIHAAALNVKIKYYPKMLERRRQIGMMYNKGLGGLPISLPVQQEKQIYQEYIIRMTSIGQFKEFMDKKGIELLIRDTVPNHKLKGLGLEHYELPMTEAMAISSVRLPTYPELTDSEVKQIIKAIRTFYGK